MKTAKLPIVDLSRFISGTAAVRQKIADEAVFACETAGFFYLTGHGISADVFDQARHQALRFFHRSTEFKSEVHITKVPHHRGYIGNFDVAPDTDKGGDVREAYKVALDLPEDDPDFLAGITLYGPNIWPRDMPGFEHAIYNLYQDFLQLADSIFSLFAIGLALPADYFEPLTRKPASVMNVNYYPATDAAPGEESSGIGAHSDYEAFAMLWRKIENNNSNKTIRYIDSPKICQTLLAA
jgi:isopenicillin N synthase-like dioxygenase